MTAPFGFTETFRSVLTQAAKSQISIVPISKPTKERKSENIIF